MAAKGARYDFRDFDYSCYLESWRHRSRYGERPRRSSKVTINDGRYTPNSGHSVAARYPSLRGIHPVKALLAATFLPVGAGSGFRRLRFGIL